MLDKISGFQPINWSNYNTSAVSTFNSINSSLSIPQEQQSADEFNLKIEQNQKSADSIVGLLFDNYA